MSAVLQRGDIEGFRAAVALRLGLHFDDTKLDHLASVLRSRLERLGHADVRAYLARVGAGDREELGALAEHLTVGETYFFRYHDHFRAFTDAVLPDRTRAASHGRRLRVLSAGAASGEEAYSVAILVREQLGGGDWDVQITGIDLNPQAIAKARRARYSAWSLRDTPADARARYFRSDGATFALDDGVRSMVSLEQRNLVDDDPAFWQPETFDVVFCRNVLMYLTHEAMCAVVARISRSLRPGGFLFLGHAETLRGISQDYHLRHTHDAFYYQRRGGPAGASDAAPTPTPGRSWDVAPSLPSDLGLGDVSWIDAIQRASDRVARLTERVCSPAEPRPIAGATAVAASAVPAREAADRTAVLEMMREERFADAMNLLGALPVHSRSEPEAQLLRAILLTNGGQHAEAEAVCRRLLAADELSAGAHYLMALCREHAGDTRAALEHDQMAAYLEPEFAMPHVHLGLLERRAGRTAAACTALERALEILPREEASRVLLFGGGFGREALVDLCRSELRRCARDRR